MTTTFSRRCFTVPPAADQHFLTPATNEALIEDYLAWKQSYTKSAYRAYRLWVTRFQRFVNKPPEQLCHGDYAAFAHSITGQFAPRCVEFALNVVHNYLRYFAEQGRLRFPMYLVRVPRAASRPHAAITEDEYRALVTSMRATLPLPRRDLAIIMLLHDTGLRLGELLSLHVADLGEDRSAVIRTEKTIQFRRVFWNPATDEILHAYLLEQVQKGRDVTDYLFPSARPEVSGPISQRAVQRLLQRHLRRAGIVARQICLHSFRHSFIHRLAKLGVPDAIIAQLVGHSTPFTISHYTKLSRPELREFAEKQLAGSGLSDRLNRAA